MPEVVIGLPEIERPVGTLISTDVTVPVPPVVVATIFPNWSVARILLVKPVIAKLVVVALVNVALPRIEVEPVEEPMVVRPAKVASDGSEVVAAKRVSKRTLVQKRLLLPSVRALVEVPKRRMVDEALT